MRLLFVTHSFPPPGRPLASLGGMQRVAVELHAALGAHPDVQLSTEALHTSWRWIEVRTALFLLRLRAQLPQRLHAERTDVVLFSSMVTALLAPHLRRKRPGVALAAIAHGQDVTMPHALYQRNLPHVFASLDAVLPVSDATGAACVAHGADAQRIHVCPNGIDEARFARLPAADAARAALQAAHAIPPDALILVSVGRQIKRKGTAWFIEAVLPHLPPHVHYVVVGDGPERAAIVQACRSAGVEGRVHLLGQVPDDVLRHTLCGGDLFLMPNIPVPDDMEGFGVVMLEAGLCGLPSVASDLEGIRNVITEGVNGHLVAAQDASAFVRALAPYAADPAALARLRHGVPAFTRATFGWPRVVQTYVHHLSALLPAAIRTPA